MPIGTKEIGNRLAFRSFASVPMALTFSLFGSSLWILMLACDITCPKHFSSSSFLLAALRQARRYVPQNTFITIYKSLIERLFNYCDVVLGNLNNILTTKLQNYKIEQPES